MVERREGDGSSAIVEPATKAASALLNLPGRPRRRHMPHCSSLYDRPQGAEEARELMGVRVEEGAQKDAPHAEVAAEERHGDAEEGLEAEAHDQAATPARPWRTPCSSACAACASMATRAAGRAGTRATAARRRRSARPWRRRRPSWFERKARAGGPDRSSRWC